MRSTLLAIAAALALVLAAPVRGDELGEHSGHEGGEHTGHLGKVNFANSCDAKVQDELQRGVAMLHSFWYIAGEKAFRHVLEEDSNCAVAAFGLAALLMNNPLAGQGASPEGAQAAMVAIEQSRRSSQDPA
jgi:hypothetical protein